MSKINFKTKAFFQLHTLIIFLLISSAIASRSVLSTTKTATNTLSFIKSSCLATTYPDLCTRTLSTYAAEITPPNHRSLAAKSLSLALKAAKSSRSTIQNLCKHPHLSPPAVLGPVRDCRNMIRDAVRQLERSAIEMDRPTVTAAGEGGMSSEIMRMGDVQSWTSAALLTDLSTCLDQFEARGVNGKVKVMVKREVGRVVPLISNALALVNSYADNHGLPHP